MLIIDGYNFLYAMLGMEHSLPIKDFEAARTKLQEHLSRYQNITHEPIKVVYDAKGGAQVPNERYAGIDVVYAPPNSDADDHIVRCVEGASRPGEIIVVSSDRELAERVKEAGGRVMGSGVFYQRMKDAFERGADPPDDRAHEKPTRPDPEEMNYFLREFGEDK